MDIKWKIKLIEENFSKYFFQTTKKQVKKIESTYNFKKEKKLKQQNTVRAHVPIRCLLAPTYIDDNFHSFNSQKKKRKIKKTQQQVSE